MGHRMGLLHRLTASNQHLDAVGLESEVEKVSGCSKVKTLELAEMADVVGRLRSVVYNPSENVPVLEAELFDGSAPIQLVWLGRRRIAGIEPGRKVRAKGRVGVHNGKLAIYNPHYELQCGA